MIPRDLNFQGLKLPTLMHNCGFLPFYEKGPPRGSFFYEARIFFEILTAKGKIPRRVAEYLFLFSRSSTLMLA